MQTKNFTEKFQTPEFKPIIKILQEKLHQGNINNQKVQKFVPVLDRNLECEKCSKTFCKRLER